MYRRNLEIAREVDARKKAEGYTVVSARDVYPAFGKIYNAAYIGATVPMSIMKFLFPKLYKQFIES